MELLGTNASTELLIPETEVQKCGLCHKFFNRSRIATHFFECFQMNRRDSSQNQQENQSSLNNNSANHHSKESIYEKRNNNYQMQRPEDLKPNLKTFLNIYSLQIEFVQFSFYLIIISHSLLKGHAPILYFLQTLYL